MGNCQPAEGSNSPINHKLMRKTKKSARSSWLKLLGHITREENSRSKILLYRQSPVVWGLQHFSSCEDPARPTGCEGGAGPGGHQSDVLHCVTTWAAAGRASTGRRACKGSLTWTKPPWVGQSSALGYFWPTDTQMVLVAASGRQGCSNPVPRVNRDTALSQNPLWKGGWGFRTIKGGWGTSAVCPANGRIWSIPQNIISLFLDKMLLLSQNTISEDEAAII